MGKRVLLVEGPDDYHFLGHFCVYCGRPLGWLDEDGKSVLPFKVQACDGYPEIVNVLGRLVTDVEYSQIGVVFDADLDLAGRWASLRDLLSQHGYIAPADLAPHGTTIEHPGDLATIGVWLMPDNELPGMLEHFVEFLVPDRAHNDSWTKAQTVVQGLEPHERDFKDAALQKAIVHTWLAWRDEPGTPLGQAVTKRYLDPGAKHGQCLADWLTNLFDLPAQPPASG